MTISAAVTGACARIAPTWPLDRFIAVNPLWGLIDQPLPSVTDALGAMTGARWLMPRAWYRAARDAGELRDAHLAAAIREAGSTTTPAQLHARLASDEPALARRGAVADLVDAERDLVHQVSWCDFITTSVSQLCAAYFDEGQAALRPDPTGGLYATWRRTTQSDSSVGLLMGLREHRAYARDLPDTAAAMIERAVVDLEIPPGELEAYLWGRLLAQNGWASWCAYRRWTARLDGRDDDAIVDLLAIRLAWEWLLYRAGGAALARRWRQAMASWPAIDADVRASRADDWLVHRALELAWHERIVRALPAGLDAPRPRDVAVQAVFCIDVRSEPLRRALEAAAPSVQTLGFAGFFGMPIAYQPLGGAEARPQLPGLLAPRVRATDTGAAPGEAARQGERRERARGWRSFKTGIVSAFTFVEAIGLAYAPKLVGDSLARPARAEPAAKPRLTATADGGPLDLATRADLAARMLRGMSLTRDFARLVLLTGHASDTRNNPHAASLDCGACGGHSGEVNARAAAALLNSPDVRTALAAQGIALPADTRFVPAVHHTVTDDVVLFDLDELPASHAADLAALRAWLDTASAAARAERARRLGLGALEPAALHRALRQRTGDWAQVRAEWGLANNASLIVAPREHCRHLDLEGRAFLHDYRPDEDPGFAILELIMTAPLVVAHWINLQYFASTVDHPRYGSGNKVLHNIVGGHLGVFEGNGGDLRIGLPLQSLHDGQRWMHTPLRLSVFIEAPRAAIDGVLAKHAPVRALVTNGWLDLFQLDRETRAVHAYRAGAWCPCAA